MKDEILKLSVYCMIVVFVFQVMSFLYFKLNLIFNAAENSKGARNIPSIFYNANIYFFYHEKLLATIDSSRMKTFLKGFIYSIYNPKKGDFASIHSYSMFLDDKRPFVYLSINKFCPS